MNDHTPHYIYVQVPAALEQASTHALATRIDAVCTQWRETHYPNIPGWNIQVMTLKLMTNQYLYITVSIPLSIYLAQDNQPKPDRLDTRIWNVAYHWQERRHPDREWDLYGYTDSALPTILDDLNIDPTELGKLYPNPITFTFQ